MAKELTFRGGTKTHLGQGELSRTVYPSSQDARIVAGLLAHEKDGDVLSIGRLCVSCFPGCSDPPHSSILVTRRRQRLICAREDYAFVFREPTKCAQTRNESTWPPSTRSRVRVAGVVESDGKRYGWLHASRGGRRASFDVVTCPGH